jgi:hypothetical protein
MKGRIMIFYAAAAALVIAGLIFGAIIRFSPSDPTRFHIALHPRPAILGQWGAMGDVQVHALMGGAYVDVPKTAQPAQAMLARLDAIALASPRTVRLAGSPDAGHITWITRSAFWGFPDYTTAHAHPQGVTVYARLRFGASDMGVNAARLRAWMGALYADHVS